jgi:hypothetical protein
MATPKKAKKGHWRGKLGPRKAGPGMLTTGQICARYGVGRTTVRRWWLDGKLEGRQVSPKRFVFWEQSAEECFGLPPMLPREAMP